MPHIHEKIDFTVEVFVVCSNKVLLRKHDKYKIWLGAGGHVELDEDPPEAARREVKEEVGLDVELYHAHPLDFPSDGQFTDLAPPIFLNRHHISATHEHVTLVYFARAATDRLHLSTTEVSEECRWFTREEIDDPQWGIHPHIRRYALAALDALA